eukprot:7148158-Alexandrium_andersonii.AAC.1
MKHLVMKHRAWRTRQSQHMKCSAILLCFSSVPHDVSPLSQRGSSQAEVIFEDVSARSAKRSML